MTGRRETFPIVCARVRMPITVAGIVLLFADGYLGLQAAWWPGLALLVVGMALSWRVGTVRREPVEVSSPVAGRWVPVHSPADRVPSHGLHSYGQTYAIDLVHEPAGGGRPGFGWWPLERRPSDFPGFGRPVHAVADGVVVRTHGWERDHWSRTSWPSLVHLLLETVRELFGVSRVIGNHVVVDHGGGVFSAYAHLRRRSLGVRTGQRVTAGQQIAECGNSGNSSEPHLHFQLMDRRSFFLAAGLPFRFAEDAGGDRAGGVPHNGEHFEGVPAHGRSQAPVTGAVR